jgi:hypothetical protein
MKTQKSINVIREQLANKIHEKVSEIIKRSSLENPEQKISKKEQKLLRASANLSPSALPSPSLDAEEPRDSPPRISPGKTSSLRCIVNEFLPFLPKPIRLFRPLEVEVEGVCMVRIIRDVHHH